MGREGIVSYPFEYFAVETNPTQTLVPAEGDYSNPKSFVNFLLPPLGFGKGWGGVKNLRLLQGLL